MREQKNPVRRRRLLAALAACSFLALGLAGFQTLAADPVPFEAGSGPWRNGAPEESCPQGTICAEWPDEENNTVTVCCVDQSIIGTYQYFQNDCMVMIGQRAFY